MTTYNNREVAYLSNQDMARLVYRMNELLGLLDQMGIDLAHTQDGVYEILMEKPGETHVMFHNAHIHFILEKKHTRTGVDYTLKFEEINAHQPFNAIVCTMREFSTKEQFELLVQNNKDRAKELGI